MPSLLVELFDHHTIEKNVYQTFICDCDEVLFLSLKKITEEERLSLKHFLLDQVSHVKQVHFRQISLDKITDDLNLFLTNYDSVTLDVFGGDSILAIFLYQYGLEKQLPIVAIDIEQGKQFKWKMGKVEKEELVIPDLTIEQLMALRGGKLIKSKQPKYSPKQMITIKKLANYAILNPEQWYQITQFFALAKTIEFHAETVKVLESNGKRYSYPESMIPLLTEANLIHIDEESSEHIRYTFSSSEAQLLCRTKGHILELYLYLLAIESEYFDECMIGAEIDWNGIFPEIDNVQNEIDVVLRKGQSIIFISCKMTDLSVEAINELEVYANHFAGETCLKLIVCSGKINPVYNHRCQEYGVLVIKQDQISNLIPMLQKHIKKHKI
ncbi:hypothetical protein AXE83_04810 [Streptococcus sp. oral taxon 431]|uniref:DUF1887 family protein n=1 Tax=Streptococcus sp. oral taxon 431 TaxID=712633 RepID=UPI0007682B89|nr:DUF1887 family protein [Streptococcus sp. oral taxon 431]AMD96955.1 hypothetical protein AXE83_04810 [Streptococcus sp. oral taxon 431]